MIEKVKEGDSEITMKVGFEQQSHLLEPERRRRKRASPGPPRRGLLEKREGKRLAHAQGSLMGVELGWSLSWSAGNFIKGRGCYCEWLHFPRGEA
jgi:hypothetical protein